MRELHFRVTHHADSGPDGCANPKAITDAASASSIFRMLIFSSSSTTYHPWQSNVVDQTIGVEFKALELLNPAIQELWKLVTARYKLE